MSVTCVTDFTTVIHIENSSSVPLRNFFSRGAVEPAAQQPLRPEQWRYLGTWGFGRNILFVFLDAGVYLNLNWLYPLNCFSAFALLLAFTFCFRLLLLANDRFLSFSSLFWLVAFCFLLFGFCFHLLSVLFGFCHSSLCLLLVAFGVWFCSMFVVVVVVVVVVFFFFLALSFVNSFCLQAILWYRVVILRLPILLKGKPLQLSSSSTPPQPPLHTTVTATPSPRMTTTTTAFTSALTGDRMYTVSPACFAPIPDPFQARRTSEKEGSKLPKKGPVSVFWFSKPLYNLAWWRFHSCFTLKTLPPNSLQPFPIIWGQKHRIEAILSVQVLAALAFWIAMSVRISGGCKKKQAARIKLNDWRDRFFRQAQMIYTLLVASGKHDHL